MSWKLEYLPEAEKDLKDLDGSQRILVLKAIKKFNKIHYLLMNRAMESHLVITTARTLQDF